MLNLGYVGRFGFREVIIVLGYFLVFIIFWTRVFSMGFWF